MGNVITAYSNYFIAVFMVLFGALSLYACVPQKARTLRLTGRLQGFFLFLIQFASYLTICIRARKIEYLFFYAVLQIVLFSVLLLFGMIYPGIFQPLVNQMCLLLTVGLIMLTRMDLQKAVRQLMIVLISMVFVMAAPFVIRKWKQITRLPWLFGALGLTALLAVLLLGSLTNGSKITYTVAGITFQPSEFVKILYLFFLAFALAKDHSLKQIVLTGLLAGAHILVLAASRDLGSALIYFAVFVFLVYLASGKARYLAAGCAGGCAAAYAAYQLFSHVQARVQAWKDPWSVIEREGYQIAQSLFAMARGGWFGLGIGKGTPKDIPYVETDFMFAAVTEEMGMLFAVGLLAVCLACFIQFLRLAGSLNRKSYSLLASGIGILYAFQIFLTVGGGTRLIPLTGVTLPLVSYGGSSVMSTLFLFAIVQGMFLIREEEEEERKEQRLTQKPGKKGTLWVCGILFGVLFLAISIHLCWYISANREMLFNHSYNSRQGVLADSNRRGTIYAADGTVLAETRQGESGETYRFYPYENLFAHVVGFASMGKSGLESQRNYDLSNTSLSAARQAANEAKGIKNPGNDVYTTLSPLMQEKASRALGSLRGAVVVTEVKTGKILAMVSKPDFDPNEIEENWDKISKDTGKAPLLNRAVQGLYPPGSTFKMITALAFIRENPDLWQSYQYVCSGSYEHEGHKIRCYHNAVHGEVDLTASFAKSCNASFANIGMLLDRGQFRQLLDSLYFHRGFGAEFPTAVSSVSLSAESGDETVIQTSIGQGETQMTVLHLNLLTAAVADGGVMKKPWITEKVTGSDGTVLKQYGGETLGQVMTAEEADVLKALMQAVVEEGTASKLKGLSYTAAGKTGSAEFNGVKEDSHAWFTGFAPVEHPEIAVTVLVEQAGSGSEFAVPVAKRILDAWFAS